MNLTSPSVGERISAVVADAQKRAEEEAAWWEGRAFEDFCPERPEFCSGSVPIREGNAARTAEDVDFADAWYDCPHVKTDCPHRRARQQREMASYLSRRGFYARHCTPRMAEVRGAFGDPVRAFISTIDKRTEVGDGLILGSAPGVGKTCILALIAWAARHRNVVYVQSIQLHAWLKRWWEHEEDLRDIEQSHLLLIDDFGTEPDDAEAQARFHHLIDERCGRERSTVISTNLFREDVEAMPHMQRVMDRLRSVSPWIEAVGEGSQRPTADWREWAGGDEA